MDGIREQEAREYKENEEFRRSAYYQQYIDAHQNLYKCIKEELSKIDTDQCIEQEKKNPIFRQIASPGTIRTELVNTKTNYTHFYDEQWPRIDLYTKSKNPNISEPPQIHHELHIILGKEDSCRHEIEFIDDDFTAARRLIRYALASNKLKRAYAEYGTVRYHWADQNDPCKYTWTLDPDNPFRSRIALQATIDLEKPLFTDVSYTSWYRKVRGYAFKPTQIDSLLEWEKFIKEKIISNKFPLETTLARVEAFLEKQASSSSRNLCNQIKNPP